MDFGQLLAGAGVVGQAWRQEEEAQRRAREQEQQAQYLARLRELQLAEMDRQERLRQQALNTPLPTQISVPRFEPGMPVAAVTTPAVTPAATPAVTPAATPAVTPAVTPAATGQLSEPKEYKLAAPFTPVQGLAGRTDDLAAYERLRNEPPKAIVPPSQNGFPSVAQNESAGVQQLKRLQNQIGQTPLDLNDLTTRALLEKFSNAGSKKSPAAQQPDFARIMNALIQVESGGNPNAVSKKGAIGVTQALAKTAADPGYGAEDVFQIADGLGIGYRNRSASEAARLLRIPEVNKRFGESYLSALLNRYNGNLDYALAAYNAGPSFVDKWIKAGADPAKLPKETQNYITKIRAILSQSDAAPAQNATAVAPSPVQKVGLNIPEAEAPKEAETDNTYIDPSNFYLANPQSIPLDMQRALQQREEVVRLAEMYRNAGMGLQYLEARNKLLELDNNIVFLHGMQGLQEFALANDPRRLAWVWSQYAGVPIGIQPRTDGKYNIFVNGRKTKEGLSSDDVASMARLAFDQSYRATQATASAETNKLLLESRLKIAEETAKQQAQMLREIYVERAKGDIQLALKQFDQLGFDVKPLGDGSGALIVTPRGGRGLPFIFYPNGIEENVGGTKVIIYHRPIHIPGL